MNTACTGGIAQHRHVEVGLERVELAAEGVAAHDDVEPAEASAGPSIASMMRVGEHDQPRARAVHGHARRRSRRLSGSAMPNSARQLVHDARLAAGDHQPVDARRVRSGR